MGEFSYFKEEDEVLILPYAGFKGISGKDDGRVIHVKLELLDGCLVDRSYLKAGSGKGIACVKCGNKSCEKRNVYGRMMCAAGPCRAKYLELKGTRGSEWARSYVKG